jgi:hypothetical protein
LGTIDTERAGIAAAARIAAGVGSHRARSGQNA